MSDEKKGDGLLIGILCVLGAMLLFVCGGGTVFFMRHHQVQLDRAIQAEMQARQAAAEARAAAEAKLKAEESAADARQTQQTESPAESARESPEPKPHADSLPAPPDLE